MENNDKKRPASHDIWFRHRRTLTADKNLEIVIGNAVGLPVKYWKPFYFFTGTQDTDFINLTGGRFPATTRPGKTHPVIALTPLPNQTGYRVNPCSSVRPFHRSIVYYIQKGCTLLHTGFKMDRDSYVVDHIHVPIPARLASRLHFRGEVPANCICTETRQPRYHKSENQTNAVK